MKNQLTEGSVFKNLFRFSLPFLLSYFLQTLYGLADLFIAGQFNGPEVLTAVSLGSQIMHMLTVVIVGLSMGSTVLIGHAAGAKNQKRIFTLIFTTSILFIFIAFIFTVLLLVFTSPIVKLISTPEESFEEARIYLKICFAGLPFIIAYNVLSSVFRGLGDSKSPMIFIALACLLNIVLDYIFMGPLAMASYGAALATVLAQAFSVCISLASVLIRNHKKMKTEERFFSKNKELFSFNEASSILKVGVPVACQDGFIQLSFLLITVIANRRGVNVAAAVGIVEKIITFLFLFPSSILSSVSALASQNLGARKTDRAEKTLFYGIAMALLPGLVFALFFQFFSPAVISLFTKDENLITLGSQYMRTYVFDCVFAAIHFSFSGYFCACGKSLYAFIHNVIAIVLVRVPGAYFASKLFPETLSPMGLAPAAGSLLSSVICIFFFMHLHKKMKTGYEVA